MYKTAVRDSIDDDTLLQMARQPRERAGHGRWSHTDLLLADIIDRLGHLGYAMQVYKKPPEPYLRPGIQRRQQRLSPEGRAYLLKLIANQGATERPMISGHSENR